MAPARADHVLGQRVETPRFAETQIVSELLEHRDRCFHGAPSLGGLPLGIGAHPKARAADDRAELDLAITMLSTDRDRLGEDRLRPRQISPEVQRGAEIGEHAGTAGIAFRKQRHRPIEQVGRRPHIAAA